MQHRLGGMLDRRRSVADQIYEALRRMIVTLELPPGEPIPETEMSARFAVSRTPVRESLLRLTNEGLVVVVPQFGTFVAPIDDDAVRQVQFMRQHLEVAVGLRLCDMGTAHLGEAHLLIAQQEAVAKVHSFAEFLPLDDRFHQSLFEAAGVGQVWTVIQAQKAHMDRIRILHTPEPGKLDEVIAQHKGMLDAIRKGDKDAVEAVIRRHTSGVLAHLDHLQKVRAELFQPLRLTRQRKSGRGTALPPAVSDSAIKARSDRDG